MSWLVDAAKEGQWIDRWVEGRKSVGFGAVYQPRMSGSHSRTHQTRHIPTAHHRQRQQTAVIDCLSSSRVSDALLSLAPLGWVAGVGVCRLQVVPKMKGWLEKKMVEYLGDEGEAEQTMIE